jgi:hypothetical protein
VASSATGYRHRDGMTDRLQAPARVMGGAASGLAVSAGDRVHQWPGLDSFRVQMALFSVSLPYLRFSQPTHTHFI